MFEQCHGEGILEVMARRICERANLRFSKFAVRLFAVLPNLAESIPQRLRSRSEMGVMLVEHRRS